MLIALTLLPAMVGFAGERVLGKRARGGSRVPVAAGERWGNFVVRRKIPVLIASIVGLGVLAIPALNLELGLPSGAQAAPDSTQRKAYDLLTEGFGPGFNGRCWSWPTPRTPRP